MGLFCVGLSHREAGVSLRERFAVAGDGMVSFLGELRGGVGLREVVVVSTCNRVEVYGVAEDVAIGVAGCKEALVGRAGVEADFYGKVGGDVVRHLTRVGAGLDSMVLGETEVFGQVKAAYSLALKVGATGRVLNRLFQMSFCGAKEVRTATGITRGAVSVGSAVCRLASDILGDLAESRVLLVGAGEAGGMVARSLQLRGVGDLVVTNRTEERAEALAEELGGRVVSFENWKRELFETDILVACASSPVRLLSAEEFEPIVRERGGREILMLDLAVPRDFDPAIREMVGVVWHDVDSLQSLAREGREQREMAMERAESVIERVVKDFMKSVGVGAENWVVA